MTPSLTPSNNQTLQESINELNKLKQEIVKLSAQEKAFAVVAKNIEAAEKSLESLEKKLTAAIEKTNKSLSISVSDAAKGLTQLSAKSEKRKWKVTWLLMLLMILTQSIMIILYLR